LEHDDREDRFDPHPGDPWHPDWTPESGGEADDLADVPAPRRGEGRLGFFRRVLGRGGREEEPSSSVEHVYDPLREDWPGAEPPLPPVEPETRRRRRRRRRGREARDEPGKRVASGPMDAEGRDDGGAEQDAAEHGGTWTSGADPYAQLDGDDDADEIAAWVAFTNGPGAEEDPGWEGDAPVPDPRDEPSGGEEAHDTDEFDAIVPPAEETAELPATIPEDGPTDEPRDEVEPEPELPEVRAAPTPTNPAEETWAGVGTEEEPFDWGNAEVAAPWSAEGLEWVGEDEEEDGEEDAVPPVEPEGDLVGAPFEEAGFSELFDTFTEDEYVQAATREHAVLADAIARSREEETEQVPLAAAIPGLDAGVIGFDDVVAAERPAIAEGAPARSNLGSRVATGLLLGAAFVAALFWRPALVVLALAVFLLAAGEFSTALMQRGYRPLSLFAFLGIGGAALGTVRWGVVAIPAALVLTTVLLLLVFAVVPSRRAPLPSFVTTVLVTVWIGGLGAFAFALIASPNYRILVFAVVAIVALTDIAQYFVGRSLGHRALAPVVSPKKTVEGLAGGIVMALLLGAAASFVSPFDLVSGLVLGATVLVFAPLGDLAVSVLKRSLDLKDMGSILPGHGGLLDRIDGLLFVIPAAWVVFRWAGLL